MKNILVIEDELSVQEIILDILDAEDFSAIGAENGRRGIELAKEHIPDLIICDIMMPEMDGYEVLTHLRQDPLTATIPFIFLTAKADKADVRQGMNLGADDYLTKPFARSELIGAIASRLEKHAAIAQPYITQLKQAEEKIDYLQNQIQLIQINNSPVWRKVEGLSVPAAVFCPAPDRPQDTYIDENTSGTFLAKDVNPSDLTPVTFSTLMRFRNIWARLLSQK
ncbi:MAG: response regulator [Aphanothece sp. CMT-3BRIN-NPC111]|jgi:CheY-like chemotaxis protein|nr:response regulator [Aphanothece sp. CMT-3BRIN-NPC111]